ncbi:unnamed protein product [Pocillopora meandrina]|uniref:P2X purinoreceptor 7 intracellular domain-containing protein n=1 Tax=Pocillopora meandrina TaxID=46732 RepID=A0AAU9XKW6_9CNID|nr:unnamed protein product [Pocillopora meandrina]
MSGIEPFQFEPVYQPGEEPPHEESVGQEVEAHEEDNTSRMGNTEWCLCGACALMPVANECYCCQELEELNQKFDNSGVRCITEHPKFGIVCLDTDVLSTALVAIHNARLNPIPDPIVNRTWRLAAYRQFTWWAHGVLGKNRRRIVPACVVTAIRKTFPEESGNYVGFREADLEL